METNYASVMNEQRELSGNSMISGNKLAALMHFPQPIFLIDRNLELLETNIQADKAIDNHWVGLRRQKLYFNNISHNKQLVAMIESLYNARKEMSSTEMPSKRFILRGVDMEYRAYTLSIESPDNDNVILLIQGDLICSKSKLHCLSTAFSLSISETRIVKLMVEGLKPKEIAYEVGLSLNTVRSHLRTLYAKMQVNNYNDALTCAIKLLV